MNPNTRIKLEDLTKEHLSKFFDIYRSLGLVRDDDPLSHISFDMVKEGIRRGSYELRPVLAIDTGKLLVGQRLNDSDAQLYIHTYIAVSPQYKGLHKVDIDAVNVCELYDQAIREEFLE